MKLIPLFLLVFTLSMCTTDTKQAKPTFCDWEEPSATLDWTMFKTTEKVAFVNTFKEIKVNNLNKSQDLITSFIGAVILVNTQSVEYNNMPNKTIAEYLFGHMMSSNTIIFTIKSMDNKTNKAVINLRMNNTDKDIYVSFSLQDNTIHIQGLLDLKDDFNAGESLYFYKTATSKGNIGEDGKNVLWRDVSFELVLKAKKKC